MISLSACLDAPMRPPRFSEVFGVKNRVNDLGVIVGGLRGLLPYWLPDVGSAGEDVGSSSVNGSLAVLGGTFSCDPKRGKPSMSRLSDW